MPKFSIRAASYHEFVIEADTEDEATEKLNEMSIQEWNDACYDSTVEEVEQLDELDEFDETVDQ